MRSGWIRGLTVAVSMSLMSGCIFTQWTDRAFLGSPADPPAHADAQWAGAAILPLAIIGDIVTAPAQAITIWAMGDWGPYHLPPQREPGMDEGYTWIDASSLRLAGVDAEHHVIEIPLTVEQKTALAARLQAGGFASTGTN